MTIVRELETLQRLVSKGIPGTLRKIISVDGFPGAARGIVSSFLNETLNLPVIYTDDYFVREGKDPDTFNVVDFSAKIARFTKDSSIIVDGVLVQDLLGRAEKKADLLLYVKRIDQYGVWPDGFKLDKLLRVAGAEGVSNYDHFQDQLVQYHLRVRPHERADFVFELSDGAP